MAPFDVTQFMNMGIGSANGVDTKGIINMIGSQVGGQSYNDIAWLSNALQTLDGGSDEQKAQVVQSLVSKVMNIFSDLTTDNTKKADNTTTKNDTAIDTNTKNAEETFKGINDTLQALLDRCDADKLSIEEALKEIDALGGEKGKIAEAQAQLEAQLEIIETNKSILNNPESKQEDRTAAISAILAACGAIGTLVSNVNGYKAEIEAQNQVVNTASADLQEVSDLIVKTVDQGTEDIQNNLQEAARLTSDNIRIQADSIQKSVLGTKQVAAGTAMESGPQALVTGSEGAQLIASGTDKIAAGTVLMKGAISGFSQIGQSVNGMAQGLSHFVNFANGIGQYNEGAQNLVGAYNVQSEAMITATGSWAKVAEANTALESYAREYANNIGVSDQEICETAGFAEACAQIQYNNMSWTRGEQEAPQTTEFTFDTNIFREAFKSEA